MITSDSAIFGQHKKAELVSNLSKEVDLIETSQILDNLFFSWVGSEDSDGTDSEYRAKVVYHYRQLTKFFKQAENAHRMEVSHE